MDANKDGVITKDEHPRPESFDRSDSDGDGKITLEELQQAFQRRVRTRPKAMSKDCRLAREAATLRKRKHRFDVLHSYSADAS